MSKLGKKILSTMFLVTFISATTFAAGKVIFREDFNGTSINKDNWVSIVESVGTIKVKDGNCVFDDTNNDGSEWTEMYSKQIEFPKRYNINYRVKLTAGHSMGLSFFQDAGDNTCGCYAKLISNKSVVELTEIRGGSKVIDTIPVADPTKDYVVITLEVDGDSVKVKGGKKLAAIPSPPMQSINLYGWRDAGITYVDYVEVVDMTGEPMSAGAAAATTPAPAKATTSTPGKVIFREDFNGKDLNKEIWPIAVETQGTLKVKDGNLVIDDTNNDNSGDWTEMVSKEMDMPDKCEISFRVKTTPGHGLGFSFYQDRNTHAYLYIKYFDSEITLFYYPSEMVDTVKMPDFAKDYVTVTLVVDGNKVKIKGGTEWATIPKPPFRSLNLWGLKENTGITYWDYVEIRELGSAEESTPAAPAKQETKAAATTAAATTTSTTGEVVFREDFNGTSINKDTWIAIDESVGTVKVKDGICIIDDSKNDDSGWTEMYSKEINFPEKCEVSYRVKITPNAAMGFAFFQSSDPGSSTGSFARLYSSPASLALHGGGSVVDTVKVSNPTTDYIIVTLLVNGNSVKVKGGAEESVMSGPATTLNIYGLKGSAGITYIDWIEVKKVK